MKFLLLTMLFIAEAQAQRPSRYTELLDFVQPAPDQGELGTCLFMASTGAMELLANKKNGIKRPVANGPYDLAEAFLIHAPFTVLKGNFYENTLLKFNAGPAVHAASWPFEAWADDIPNVAMWNWRNQKDMRKVDLPKIETEKLFVYKKHATHILDSEAVERVKEALWKNRSPVLVNVVDDFFWHVVLIVGYDDDLPGKCYEITDEECGERRGSFYVRDSFGVAVELRDYDWFRITGNAAVVVRLAP